MYDTRLKHAAWHPYARGARESFVSLRLSNMVYSLRVIHGVPFSYDKADFLLNRGRVTTTRRNALREAQETRELTDAEKKELKKAADHVDMTNGIKRKSIRKIKARKAELEAHEASGQMDEDDEKELERRPEIEANDPEVSRKRYQRSKGNFAKPQAVGKDEEIDESLIERESNGSCY